MTTVSDTQGAGAHLRVPGQNFFPEGRSFADYELIEEIARGGMGVVYKARQKSLNRVVAVKMILAGEFAGEAHVQRFRQEAEAAANLQHPGIVSIHEIGQHEGRHFFSMDFVEGRNLGTVIGSTPVPGRRAAEWVRILADAVGYAHQRGILHRDLKPQNILVGEDGRLRITDFGLAKRVESDSGVTRTGAVLGSPSYMPPEQASGRHADVGPASDVYSLGAILYEMLTGRPPFQGDSAVQVMMKVMHDEVVPPSRLNPDIPEDLETICLKCLEKEPVRRYSSAKSLDEDMARFLTGVPIYARPAGGVRKLWSWGVRNPWAIAGLLSLALISSTGMAYAFWERGEFFRWVAENGKFEREPGLLTRDFKAWCYRIGPMVLVTLLLIQWLLNELIQRRMAGARAIRIRGALGIILGAVAVVMGFVLLSKGIAAWIWEGSHGLVLQNASRQLSPMLHTLGQFLIPVSLVVLLSFLGLPFQIGLMMMLRGLEGRGEGVFGCKGSRGLGGRVVEEIQWTVPGLRVITLACVGLSLVFGGLVSRKFGTGLAYLLAASSIAILACISVLDGRWRSWFRHPPDAGACARVLLFGWLGLLVLFVAFARVYSGYVLGLGFSALAGFAAGGCIRISRANR